ncbi:hypothetical protein Cni_G08604 [Canna indica]|uniref:Uncharacterized protein n=1 Tax=Canna indica TaxID=4628 RepID=A0AAQ3Q8K2_9LILI|nr:hypothetical protein Cni_G08604 [Canna indica]
MAETISGPWILDAAPFIIVVLLVAHVSALVCELAVVILVFLLLLNVLTVINPPIICCVSRFIGCTDWPLINRSRGLRRIRQV